MKIGVKGSTVEKVSSCYVGDAAASRRAKDCNDSKWMVRRKGWGVLGICHLKKVTTTYPKQRKTWGNGV